MTRSDQNQALNKKWKTVTSSKQLVAHEIIRRTKIFSSWCVGPNFSYDYNDVDLDENAGGGVTNLI